MPLYNIYTEQELDSKGEKLPPLILGTPKLQLRFCTEERVAKEWPRGDLIQDIFELSNSQLSEQAYVLLPNGCSLLLFILRPHTAGCYFCGPLTTAKKVRIPVGGKLFGVRIKVGRLNWFYKRLAPELADQVFPLHRCFFDADTLLDKLRCMDTFSDRCAAIFGFFEMNGAAGYRADPLIQDCINLIQESGGQCRVHDLAEKSPRSERILSRRFRDMTGLSMKTYCEMVKFQNSFYSIQESRPRILSGAVKKFGYYDLPHMNRAYRKFINYTASDIRYINMDEMYAQDLFSVS